MFFVYIFVFCNQPSHRVWQDSKFFIVKVIREEKKTFICSPTYSCFVPLKSIVWERKSEAFFSQFKKRGDVFIHVTRSPNGNNTGVLRARLGKQPAFFDLLHLWDDRACRFCWLGTFSDGSFPSYLRTGGIKRKKIKFSVMHVIWQAFQL